MFEQTLFQKLFGGRSTSVYLFTCLPDTMDPRGPKRK